jgi:hypothetical protein
MNEILKTDEWELLINQLQGYVDHFNQKVIAATGGFQV